MDVAVDYTIRDQQRMQRAWRYFSWQAALASRHLGDRVLEVGCGVGNFTRHLIDRQLVVGLDVVDECVTHHKQRFASYPGVESVRLDILDPLVLNLRNRNLDSIACLNVLEHISDDYQALRHMHALLPRSGRAVFIVPAFSALYGPIDRHLGHYRRYSKRSWAQLAEATGFRQVITRYMNMPGFFGWWVNARILNKHEQSSSQIAIFDSLLVPICARMEAVVSPPFGQSLFAVIERQ
jgi:ubiquinone/menaquinone biosynthesis C-methylase UbiE